VVAALTQAYIDTAEQVPMIGASGAIAGVLGDYLVLNPRGNVVVLIWILLLIGLIAVAGPDAGIVVPGAAERTVSDEERDPGVRLRDVCRRIPRQYLPGGDPPAAANPIAAARPRPLLRRPVRGEAWGQFGRGGDWGGPWG
jgi:Rhomboid family